MSNWKKLQHMPAAEQRALQDDLLRRHVRHYLYPFSSYYREVFDRAGVSPNDIETVDDLRRIPMSCKRDLLPDDDDPQRFRRFILQPEPATLKQAWPLSKKLPLLAKKLLRGADAVKADLRREFYPCFMSFTTGRSAEPVPFFYSPHDIQNLHITGRRLVEVLGLDSELRVANLFPYAPHLAFWQVVFAGLDTGMMVLSTGGGKVMGSSGDLRAISRIRAEALIGVPGYIYHLLRRGAEEGVDLSSVKCVVLGAERVPPGLKDKIRLMLSRMGAGNVQVFGTYGFTEARMAFAECPTAHGTSDHNQYTGYHLYPDMGIFEVVDPKTGDVVPEGEDGELVFTPLQGRASTVFRYRTGDLVRGGIQTGPCPNCGRTLPRISSDLCRESSVKDLQLLKVKGTLVNLEDCAMILGDLADIEEWQIELQKKDNDPHEVDELVIHVAVRSGCDEDAVAQRVREQFRGRIEVSPNRVEFLGLPAMLDRLGMEREMKEKRFVDSRPQE